jgi:hypothetical protein
LQAVQGAKGCIIWNRVEWNGVCVIVIRIALGPAIARRAYAASFTERQMGPIESCTAVMGIATEREVKPVEGLIPIKPFWLEGAIIEPPVSVPIVIALRPILAAMADLEKLPDGSVVSG